MNATKRDEGELWMLYRMAHELYLSEVIGAGKLYKRYVNDFLNSHTYTDRADAAGRNEHKKNFHIMEEVLTLREDLVRKYFGESVFCNPDYSIMHREFNTTPHPSGSEAESSPLQTVARPDFQCCFTPVQIELLTRSVNAVRLFVPDVSEAEVEALFDCRLEEPLKSACNRKVAFFFDALCELKLISTKWQHVIDKNRLILSSGKNACLNNSQLSSALSEAKQNGGCVYKKITQYVQGIKNNSETW